jgi:sRNA-binding carbon storage regulator CsrA
VLFRSGRVVLGITAPREVAIDRERVRESKMAGDKR